MSEPFGTEWSHDGDGWAIDVGGACPVQGTGHVDGHPLYFRARGWLWSVRIAWDHDADPVLVVPGSRVARGFIADGSFGESRGYAASWMQPDVSRALVSLVVDAFRRRSRDPAEGEVIVAEVVTRDVPEAAR